MAWRLEATRGPFPLSRWLMRVFGTIIQPFVAAMLDARNNLRSGCLVTAQLVRDQHAWDILAALQELAEELEGCAFVATALHQDIQDVPMLINGAP